MNRCESYRFGIMNEEVNRLKIEEALNGPAYIQAKPIEVRVAALNFALECAKMGACEQTADAIVALANRIVNNYFK